MAKRKFITIDDARFEKQHLSRMEKYAEKVEAIFRSALDEYAKLGSSIKNVNLDKLFSFKDYPETKEKLDKIINVTYGNTLATVQSGIKDEWKFSALKNDEVVKAVLGKSRLSKADIEKYANQNIIALKAFQNRKDGPKRLGLSERIWNYANDQKTEVELALDIGIGEGKSAVEIANLLKTHLKQPSNIFRRVRNKRGGLVPSKAMEAYNPGTGVYRSSFKNAARVARTETNMAYRAADYERWNQLDFVVGIEIRLSNNPNHCKLCAALAGKYPKEFKFVGWHPQCRCHAVSILKTQDEIDREERAKFSGNSDNSKGNSENSVNDVPDSFKEWVDINKDREVKNTPFWVKDNFKDGDIKKGLNFKSKKDKPPRKAVEIDDDDIINLNNFIKGDQPTNKEIESIMLAYAQKNPENFRTGLGSVKFTNSRSFMMQHAASYKPSTNEWVGKADITISNNTFLTIGFNPANEFKQALVNIKNGVNLTFNQEYSIEALWHEILHAKTLSPPRKLSEAQTAAMETVNQFVARHTYTDFLKSLGGKAVNKKNILEKGYGYTNWIKDFRKRLKANGISEKTALEELTPILMKDYRSIQFELMRFFEKHKK
ncbi:structural protein [Pedobacter nototheniae]|uniref:hypothetical protein n=1 Tax=Pedobacter nototheniae TaxID=2488994 RepID=UPI001B8D741E|nr:hypothetical protein [Pedobacter nototheniae]